VLPRRRCRLCAACTWRAPSRRVEIGRQTISTRRVPSDGLWDRVAPRSRTRNSATSCSQSRIERDGDLPRQRAAQVEGALALSVVVRSGPVVTAGNGTLVARPSWPWRSLTSMSIKLRVDV
jgi:hypothetical protein